MLYLTRRVNEKVTIYVNHQKVAELVVNNVRGQQVRLGLDAGPEVTFVRSELDQRDGA